MFLTLITFLSYSCCILILNSLEIWDKTGQSILASMFSGKFDTRNDPLVFAGTRWYFYFYTQFLHAKGPLTESCEIKVYKKSYIIYMYLS